MLSVRARLCYRPAYTVRYRSAVAGFALVLIAICLFGGMASDRAIAATQPTGAKPIVPTHSDPLHAVHGLPEPTGWAMMLTGAGIVGYCLRRQRAFRIDNDSAENPK